MRLGLWRKVVSGLLFSKSHKKATKGHGCRVLGGGIRLYTSHTLFNSGEPRVVSHWGVGYYDSEQNMEKDGEATGEAATCSGYVYDAEIAKKKSYRIDGVPRTTTGASIKRWYSSIVSASPAQMTMASTKDGSMVYDNTPVSSLIKDGEDIFYMTIAICAKPQEHKWQEGSPSAAPPQPRKVSESPAVAEADNLSNQLSSLKVTAAAEAPVPLQSPPVSDSGYNSSTTSRSGSIQSSDPSAEVAVLASIWEAPAPFRSSFDSSFLPGSLFDDEEASKAQQQQPALPGLPPNYLQQSSFGGARRGPPPVASVKSPTQHQAMPRQE